MKLELSNRVQILSESMTIAISSLARSMKAAGEDVISLSAGEPDFDTPKAVKEAVIEAMEKGASKYTASAGTPECLKAVAYKLKNENNLNYSTSDIVTSVGAKHSLFSVFSALINKGDEVIIPVPYWVTYPEIVKYCGGVPVFVQGDKNNKLKITAGDLKKVITPRTKAFVIGSPSNPSGSVYSKKELLEFADVLKDTNIIVISDEIYEKINYVGGFVSVAALNDDMFERTITINGLSKSAAVTGWRFGYLASPQKNLIAAIKKLQSQSVSNISSIVQAGAIPALLGKCNEDVKKMLAAYKERRDWFVDAINSVSGLSVIKPEGAFYLFVDCGEVEKDSLKFCKKLLESEKVATVPGIGFGMDGYFRASFATDLESIKKGFSRIEKFVKNYKA